MATSFPSALGGNDDSDQSSTTATSPLNTSTRDTSRRGRSYTASSVASAGSHHQRNAGATSPPLQEPAASRPSLEQTFTRRPSQARIHPRQTSHTTSTSVTSASSSRGNSAQDGATPPSKPTNRIKESPNGGLFAGSSPESIAGSGKEHVADSPSATVIRAGTIANGSANGANMNSSTGEWMSRDNHLQIPSSRTLSHDEPETVGGFALEHLFNSFVSHADQKIVKECSSTKLLQPEPPLDSICGLGIDPTFDQLLSSMGYIVRYKPKPLVDKMISWRQGHAEPGSSTSSDPAELSNKFRGDQINRNAGLSRAFSPLPSANTTKVPAFDPTQVAKERRNAFATYILCRALIEILGQTTLSSLTLDVTQRLETIVYDNQLRTVTRDALEKSPMKSAKWDIATQLVGVLGDLDFEGVAGRFLRDLRAYQKDLAVKNGVNKDAEADSAHVMKSMRYLRLNPDYDLEWIRSCNFMQSITDLFNDVHGQPAKISYCRLINLLLLSCADKCSASFDRTGWKKFVHTLSERLIPLAAKPKYWQYAYPVQASLACVSPSDIFVPRFQLLTGAIQGKIRERQNRATLLKSTCHLVWTYIQRSTENTVIKGKNLEDIGKLIFFSGKRYSLSSEPAVAEALIQLIRIIGFHYQDVCFRSIVFPLINSDLFYSSTDTRDLKVEHLDPDRMVIGIRAFLTILNDLENNEPPPFPAKFDDERAAEQQSISSSPIHTKPRSSSRKPSLVKAERLSKPVITTGFSDVTKEYYRRFCEILGKITIICDNAFGGQAVLDEKFASSAPKTPISENWVFGRKDDHLGVGEERLGFYDLLHVAIQALPRALSSYTPLNQLLNLLCTGTAHIEKNIAFSSATSLKSIAKQGHAQVVTGRFSGFILNYDNRYSTMSDGGMLGPNHIEDTLKLYVELLNIWIDELLEKNKVAGLLQTDEAPSTRQLNAPATLNEVDRVESHGLFFLCSPSPRVRGFAVEVLNIVTRFDNALGQNPTRITQVLEGKFGPIIDPKDERLSIAERSRLEKAISVTNPQNALIDLCSGTGGIELDLWNKIFPKLIQVTFQHCPLAVTQTKGDVCGRLSQMQNVIEALEDRPRGLQSTSFDGNSSWIASRSSDLNIEQWKLYLMFACTTIMETGNAQQANGVDVAHTRKGSKSSQGSRESFKTALGLFSNVVPMLSFHNGQIRNAAVIGLGSININLYRTLLESLEQFDRSRGDETRKAATSHQRAASSPKRFQQNDHFLFEAAYLYMLTSHFLQVPAVHKDEWIVEHVATYTRDLAHYLQRAEGEPGFQLLRLHFCGLVEGLFLGVERTSDPQKWMSFQTRRAAFMLMEGWCGLSLSQDKTSHEHSADQSGHAPELRRGPGSSTAMGGVAKERRLLTNAALSAMATLCGGPISVRLGNVTHQFEPNRIFQWINKMVNSEGDKMPAIGRRALRNMLEHNTIYPLLTERVIGMLYLSNTPKGLESYVEVIADVLKSDKAPQVPFWKVLSAFLFVLGSDQSTIRMKSAKLLRYLDEKQGKSSKLQELDISISDKTTAVNKKAQFEISQRLASQYPEQAFHVFSEFSAQFNHLQPDQQRNMVLALLPWIKTIQLVVDSSNNGTPTAGSYMLLVNLLDITMNCSSTLHHEIQALWQALSTGPHAGNVQVVLDFIIELALYMKDQKIVEFARQIVVFLSSTQAGHNVIEYLLQRITPKQMCLPEKEKQKDILPPQEAKENFPYLAEFSTIPKDSSKQAGMSLSQLCLILLVDLIVSPVTISADRIPIMLQAVLVLWDHYMGMLQDQAREMLVHLIHELVLSKIDNAASPSQTAEVQHFIDLVQRRDPKVVWNYEDNDGIDCGYDPPKQMVYVVTEVVKIFSITHPALEAAWGRMTLDWSIMCPVRHLACRSLQIYRCILKPFDQRALSDLLWRLSITVSDEVDEIQAYSMELMRTVRTTLAHCGSSDSHLFPQLFWTLCACLSSVNEFEFLEALSILELFLENFDLGDTMVLAKVMEVKPKHWDWAEQDLTSLIYKGCKSGASLDKTLRMLDRLIRIPSNQVVGDDSRLLFTVLANMPRFTHAFHQSSRSGHTVAAAVALATAASEQGCPSLSRILYDFANTRSQNDKDFIAQILSSISSTFFPRFRRDTLIFMMGFLSSNCTWFKVETLKILEIFLSSQDMQHEGSMIGGSDLITPLLRLLQTDLSSQALLVLDRMTMIQGAPINKQHLQMSMAGSRASQAMRKEYERTESLYGIPEETGWSIPMPAIHKESARSNLAAVFNTFTRDASVSPSAAETPEVEFYKDHPPGSYFPERSATMTSDEAFLADTSMGELASKLDALDDFFEGHGDGDDLMSSPSFTVPNSTASTPIGLSRQTTMDMPTYTSSFSSTGATGTPLQNTSFSSTLSENIPPAQSATTRDPGIMSPSAFSVATKPPTRPSIGPRSITSPATNQATPPDKTFAVPPEEIETLSDDDLSAGRTSTSDRSIALDGGAAGSRPVSRKGSFKAGMRSGLKRLTGSGHGSSSGGGGGDKSRGLLRIGGAQDSPEVPKVPDFYLQNPKSSDP